jgi:hypothetical protein
LLGMSFENIFSHSAACIFIVLREYFEE